jgi:hypothetical protein
MTPNPQEKRTSIDERALTAGIATAVFLILSIAALATVFVR